MIKYVFADTVAIKGAKDASPQVIGEALAAVADAHAGRLTPGDVVESARAPDSPLHRHFEWDDAVAAESYRLDQAREIIRVVRVDDDNAEEPARAFLSIGDADGVSYRAVAEVRASRSLQLAVMKQAERDLEAFERRYRSLKDVCEDVRVIRERVTNRRTAEESRA